MDVLSTTLQSLSHWLRSLHSEYDLDMGPYTVQRVENATEEQLRTSVEIFYDLMHNDLSAVALCGGDRELIRVQALALLRAGSRYGECYTATDEDGEILGFTLWMPPGQEMFSTEEQRQLGFYDFMEKLSDEGKEYFKTTYLAKFPKFVESVLGPTGKLDSWWMHMCMVRQEHQRRGIATALIDLVKQKAKEKGEKLACSTTQDVNIIVYTSLGFTHHGMTVLPSPWGEWYAHLLSFDTAPTTSGGVGGAGNSGNVGEAFSPV